MCFVDLEVAVFVIAGRDSGEVKVVTLKEDVL